MVALVESTRELLETLRAPLLAPFLAEWPGAAANTPQRREAQPPASLPVLRWLNLATTGAAAPAFSRNLVTALVTAAPAMSWKQTYATAQTSPVFLQNYGWSEIIGTTGEVPSERLACGFLLLGPHTLYPRHHHEAEEIYIPIAGTAAWEKGDEGWRERPPGSVIHHPSHIPHATRTTNDALVALYLWRSDNLHQKAQLLG